jgi:hypothetical protein
MELDHELLEQLKQLGFSTEPSKDCALSDFVKLLDYVKTCQTLGIADIQIHLRCKFSTAVKVFDALKVLCVIEEMGPNTRKHQRCVSPEVIDDAIAFLQNK